MSLKAVILILLLGPIALSKSLKEHWRDIGLKIDLIHEMLTTCEEDKTKFLGCAFAFDAAFKLEKLTLIPKTLFEVRNDFGRKNRDFGQTLVVGIRRSNAKSLGELHIELKNYRKELNEHWLKLYTSKDKMQFDPILEAIKELPTFKNDESFLTATMMNIYLNVIKDPHTMVIPSKYYLESLLEKTNYVGIGATLRIEKIGEVERVIVDNLMENGPALKAGVRTGDIILEINGKPAVGVALDGNLYGKPGTSIELTIKRNKEILKINVVKELIDSPNVKSKTLEKSDEKLGYLKLSSFMSKNACDETKEQLLNLTSRNDIKGIIFDLRDNRGGLLTQAICIAQLFLIKNAPITEVRYHTQNKLTESFVNKEEPITNLPMTTIINERSASASEILASALQDNRRSFLVGIQTFGKGSVQVNEILENGLLIKFVTVGWFYRPSGSPVQIAGVQPDFTVYRSPELNTDMMFIVREEDEYLTVPPEISPKSTQQKPEVISAITKCIQEEGFSLKRYEEEKDNAIRPDYQLMYSEDVLNCALKLKIDIKPEESFIRGTEIGNGSPRKTSHRFLIDHQVPTHKKL